MEQLKSKRPIDILLAIAGFLYMAMFISFWVFVIVLIILRITNPYFHLWDSFLHWIVPYRTIIKYTFPSILFSMILLVTIHHFLSGDYKKTIEQRTKDEKRYLWTSRILLIISIFIVIFYKDLPLLGWHKVALIFILLYFSAKYYLNFLHFKDARTEHELRFYTTKSGQFYTAKLPFEYLFSAYKFNFDGVKSILLSGTHLKSKRVPFPSFKFGLNINAIQNLTIHSYLLDIYGFDDRNYTFDNLKNLRIINCTLKDTHKLFHKLSNLPSTKISNLEISNSDISSDIVPLPNSVGILQITECKLPKIPFTFTEQSNCKRIDFSKNQITFLPNLDNTKINEINLSYNKLNFNALGTLPLHLETIILSNNPLVQIPKEIFTCKQIRYIDLTNCELTTIDETMLDALSNLWSLRKITLKKNNFSGEMLKKISDVLGDKAEID